MRPAAVGFQCPDDVAAGQRSVRTPTNPLGGPTGKRQPIVTWTLVALNVVAFVLEGLPVMGLPAEPNEFVRNYVGFSQGFLESPSSGVADPGNPLRLLSSAFLHASIFHIGLNMLALVLLGRQLEQVLGRARFLALYVVSALGGSALYFLLGEANGYQVGASGAIFGLFSAFYLVARRLRVDSSSILTTIGINLVLTVLIPGISLWGHLGGLATGAAVGLIYTTLPSRPATARALQIALVVGLGVLMVLGVAIRSAGIA